ncbi:hypothetical protein [Tianweitania sp.]|uniref:hypothetical protein n=1 Tax=Tianweitania sp. TaxID=2021634 RepID=UPI002897B5D1|nr:hypothetical protein [Tianweitania sp.]
MATCLQTFLYGTAIRLAMRRPAPSRFTLSGEEANRHNFYEVRLFEHGSDAGFLVLRMTPGGAWVLPFNEARERLEERELLTAEFPKYRLWIAHYYRKYRITSETPGIFILKWLTGYPIYARSKEDLTQALYNLRPLSRKERYELLRHIIQQTEKKKAYKTSSFRLMNESNFMRSMLHPQAIETMSHYDMVLP